MTVEPLAVHEFDANELDAALEFLKRTRSELRMLRKAHVWTDRLQVFDVNGDCFEVRGVGYPDEPIKSLLDAIDAVYKPDQVHQPFKRDFKEYQLGRRYAWGADRVM